MTSPLTSDQTSTHIQYFRMTLMGFSAFIMNTTEFVPVALLSDIAADFSISTAEAGWMLTLYAWIVAGMSLPLMLLTSKVERKKLLLMLFTLFTASHLLAMFAWSFNILLISRVGIALSHALFWSITAAIALRVAPTGKKALSLSIIATGTSLAMVLGVPIGRVIGQWFGWRTTFGSIGLVAALILILHFKLLPTLPSMFKGSFRKVPELLTNPLLVCLYIFIFIIFTSHYVGYSYIEPFMRQIGAISDNLVTFVLLLFGGAGILGGMIFSRFGEKYSTVLLSASTVIMIAVLAMLLFVSSSIWALSISAVFWGAALLLLILTVQDKILMVDEHAQDMVMSMFSGIINLGIGTGAFIGGYVVTTTSLSSVGMAGSVIACLALLLLIFTIKHFPELR